MKNDQCESKYTEIVCGYEAVGRYRCQKKKGHEGKHQEQWMVNGGEVVLQWDTDAGDEKAT